jgi:hypothetical protein
MPISIAGSGTITGISAGGLPDDCITTAEIAANAVTYAKIGTTEQGQLCRAWVNFNGTGTVAIRASYNVSSITDNGAGDYTVNFTTTMVDANYCVTTSGKFDSTYHGIITIGSQSSGSVTVWGMTGTLTAAYLGATYKNDQQIVNVAIFR